MTNNRIPIFFYHSIFPKSNKNWVKSYLTLELKYFEEHLKYFKKKNFKALFFNEYFDLKNQERMEGKYFLLTFDDGYLDNYAFVYPLLKKYGFKGTIFVNPEFVDLKAEKRKTLFDYWNNKATIKDIENWGFLSWQEMREMENNGVIDIQSHTLTHTKYFISDKLSGFHHPGADCIYAIGNLFPEHKPYYINDKDFIKLIPFGYPFFEKASSVIARKVDINEEFNKSIVNLLKDMDWSSSYDFEKVFNRIRPVYEEYKKTDSIISKRENDKEYEERVYGELKVSKNIIEEKLGKTINYLCWPHGDNNEFAHNLALEIGYKATTLGKMSVEYMNETRFDRFGLGNSRNSLVLTNLKTRYKVGSFMEKQPYHTVQKIYHFIKK